MEAVAGEEVAEMNMKAAEAGGSGGGVVEEGFGEERLSRSTSAGCSRRARMRASSGRTRHGAASAADLREGWLDMKAEGRA